jgi:acylphosphatase
MADQRLEVKIRGRVQGVWFRASTRDEALRLGLTGWVRNLPDGRVEAVFEGPKDKIIKMLAWCWQGPPGARVDQVEENQSEASCRFTDFRIRY